MTPRFYIVPTINTGLLYLQGVGNIPAYIEAAGCVVLWQMQYGLEPFTLVYTDATAAQNTLISANVDAFSVPINIDNNVGSGAVVTVQNALETIGIPGTWVTTSFTYRDILRMVGGLFVFAQTYRGMHNLRLFRGGVTLSTQFDQLPANERQRLRETAAFINFDIDTLNANSTIRVILRTLALWYGTKPLLERGGVVIL